MSETEMEPEDAFDACIDCNETFRFDDTGGYNPPCRCGLCCRGCCDLGCYDGPGDGDETPDDPEEQEGA